jgi:hypothetical protein
VAARIRFHPAAHGSDDFSKKLNSARQLRQLTSAQPFDGGGQLLDAARAPCGKYIPAFRRRLNPRQPPVARVAAALHETVLLQAGHDPRHRRWPHLLRLGELAEGQWSAEDDNGKSGEAGGRQAADIVLLAELPQEMDRG